MGSAVLESEVGIHYQKPVWDISNSRE